MPPNFCGTRKIVSLLYPRRLLEVGPSFAAFGSGDACVTFPVRLRAMSAASFDDGVPLAIVFPRVARALSISCGLRQICAVRFRIASSGFGSSPHESQKTAFGS